VAVILVGPPGRPDTSNLPPRRLSREPSARLTRWRLLSREPKSVVADSWSTHATSPYRGPVLAAAAFSARIAPDARSPVSSTRAVDPLSATSLPPIAAVLTF